MIEKISFLGTKFPYINNSHREEKKPKIYNDKSKILLTSLITAAAVTTGVILAAKHIQAKRMMSVGEKIIQKPRIFGEKDVQQIAENWADNGMLDIGDRVAIIPKSVLQNIAKSDKEYANVLKGMKMSDTGFGITIMRAHDNIDFEALRYYDPECITILKMVDAIKNDRIYYCEVG